MAEYVERTAALEITTRTCGDYAAAWSEIRKLPAADVAPVIHSYWEAYSCSQFMGTDGWGEPKWRDGRFYICGAVCGIGAHIEEVTEDHYFCYYCGAKMDEEDIHE